jgi:hypothetical protein
MFAQHKSKWVFAATAALFCAASLVAQKPTTTPPKNDLGYTDTPILPGTHWHVHDPARPYAPVIAPGATPGAPPSDAIILFDGHDLSHWTGLVGRADRTATVSDVAPQWKVSGGILEVVPHTSDIATKEKFGNVQLHLEWSEPPNITGSSQGRGNSGVLLMDRYEVQVLDPWQNPTYSDGSAAAVYGQTPPLVNPGRRPGEWNTYDILFTAPRFDGDKLLTPAYVTVLFNGVVVQNHTEILGPTQHRKLAHYVPQPAEAPLVLQNHNQFVRFRNIWIRRLDTSAHNPAHQ